MPAHFYRFLHRRFLEGFVLGATVSSASCLAALYLYDRRREEPEPVIKSPVEEFGFPQSGAEARQYISHALSYDQAKKIPRWVIEHLTTEKTIGNADRKHCKFKPDPNIPQVFSATNEDYWHSGWSRGHMAPAGDSKYSTEAMAETFYLSNIVPQNYENNAGFWNRIHGGGHEGPWHAECTGYFYGGLGAQRTLATPMDCGCRIREKRGEPTLHRSGSVWGRIGCMDLHGNCGFEMYCRDLTKRFDDVWVVSGPLTLPVQHEDGSKTVTYRVIGKDDVAVPSHLYKVILAKKNQSAELLAEGAFIVPNVPISFDHQLPEYQVQLEELEKLSGLIFFPKVDRSKGVRNICEADTCKLIQLEEFKLFIAGRRMKNARNLQKVEKIMSELMEANIKPDQYLTDLYEQKKKELASDDASPVREGRRG
ncbi:nuclease EXOG, mitochondrial isoform X1 [Pseudophryne corroboree]|uniref:nuclease EXOG, mitochondrial isoform X1 n=1 Tax=Pseudophryne corroboree TaxID=495146 RepID=UPI00308167DE